MLLTFNRYIINITLAVMTRIVIHLVNIMIARTSTARYCVDIVVVVGVATVVVDVDDVGRDGIFNS
jgi:hypothetical protein